MIEIEQAKREHVQHREMTDIHVEINRHLSDTVGFDVETKNNLFDLFNSLKRNVSLICGMNA